MRCFRTPFILWSCTLAFLAGSRPAPAQGTNPCTPAQCTAMRGRSAACGSTAPYACVTTGGCYATAAAAAGACANNWCYFGSCVTPVSSQPTRTITFFNFCSQAFAVYQNSTQIVASLPTGGTPQKYTIQLEAQTNDWGQTYYRSAGGAGVLFRAMPDDKDLSNSTLFEVNFGAYGGTADVYDVSAIPPSSCAGHMQTTDNQYGYADHLPFKNPKDPTQSWACLKDGSGNPIPGTCGDGLGWQLCPAVPASATVAGTVQPPTAKNGNPAVYGCGVPGEQCCTASNPGVSCTAQSGGCCPNVCAVTGTQDPTATNVRNLVHNCAYQQSLAVATSLKLKTPALTPPRQTGFWKAVTVNVSQKGQSPGPGCVNLKCAAGGTEKSPTFDNMATTCKDGYLWPYDDASATVTCGAAPNYQVVFCG